MLEILTDDLSMLCRRQGCLKQTYKQVGIYAVRKLRTGCPGSLAAGIVVLAI